MRFERPAQGKDGCQELGLGSGRGQEEGRGLEPSGRGHPLGVEVLGEGGNVGCRARKHEHRDCQESVL